MKGNKNPHQPETVSLRRGGGGQGAEEETGSGRAPLAGGEVNKITK